MRHVASLCHPPCKYQINKTTHSLVKGNMTVVKTKLGAEICRAWPLTLPLSEQKSSQGQNKMHVSTCTKVCVFPHRTTPAAPQPKHLGFVTLPGSHQGLWPPPSPSISGLCVCGVTRYHLIHIFYHTGSIVNSCRFTCQTTFPFSFCNLLPLN